MQKIVIFGKGGIGKSTVASNMAVVYAQAGRKVLLVGCDPKHDTTVGLTGGNPIPTAAELPGFMDLKARAEQFVVKGAFGIDCVEAGGPEPGIGCAGRGISRMVEMLDHCGLLKEDSYDVILFDVLGDVVCGGFAAPLRHGLAEKVCIVLSEEVMALYAANNIARAIRTYASNGGALIGLVANVKDPKTDRAMLERFAQRLGTEVLTYLPRDPLVRKAEYAGKTVMEGAPKAPVSLRLKALAEAVWKADPKAARVPTPLADREFHRLSRTGFEGPAAEAAVAVESRPVQTPAPRPQPTAPPHAPPPDLSPSLNEAALKAWAEAQPQGERSGWVDGPHAKQWGDPRQWRLFFCDLEAARNRGQNNWVNAPVLQIAHEDLECHYATPFFEDEEVAFFNYPWVKRFEKRPDRMVMGAQGFTTDLREGDVIAGGSRKLGDTLDLAVEMAEGKNSAIIVTTTCVPTVIGDDAKAIIEKAQKKCSVPIFFSSPAAGYEMDMHQVFFQQVKEEPGFRGVQPQDRCVNLIGFPEGRYRAELEALLRNLGISVNLWMLPELDPVAARRFLAASVHVFYPDPALADLYRKLFSDLELRSVTPVAPYGLAGTKEWLLELSRPLGMQGQVDGPWESVRAENAALWQKERERSRGRRLALVADAASVRRLSDPKGLSGVPLVRLLKEMGFRLDYLVHTEKPAAPAAGGAADDHAVRWFTTPEELRGLLAEGRFDAVYSEFFFDRRLTAAGKAQFSLGHFEMGIEGALRGFRRLNDLCAWPFYKRYGRYLEEVRA